MEEKLNSKKTKIFLLACLISTLGSSLTNLALAYKFLLQTKTGTQYSIIIYAALLSTIVMLPWSGYYIDRLSRSQSCLIPFNILSGLCLILLANTGSITFAFILVFTLTFFANIENTIIFKLLPSILDKDKLVQINIKLQEITTIGFIFGPMVAPLIQLFFLNDKALFYFDAVSFFIAAVLFEKSIYHITLTESKIDTELSHVKMNFYKAYMFLLEDIKIRNYLFCVMLYLLAFSPMAYTLALVAKNVADNSTIYYSLPILSMFFGRFLSTRYISRLLPKNNTTKILIGGLLLSGLSIFPISLTNSIVIICVIEFLLGIFIAQVSLSEKLCSQYICPSQNLSKLSTTKQIMNILAKFISVLFISYLVEHQQINIATPILAMFFIASGLYLHAKNSKNAILIRDEQMAV